MQGDERRLKQEKQQEKERDWGDGKVKRKRRE